MRAVFLMVCMLLAGSFAMACDICGCGAGSNYIGILPEFSKHIAGIRYRYNVLKTHLGAGGAATYLTTKEVYETTEVWGGWNIGKHFRVMATVPVSFNKLTNQGVTSSKSGLGDISVNGYYQLLNSKTVIKNNRLLVQSLWAGGGIKLPTGRYNPADKSGTAQNANLFQLGTASADFMLNAMYDLRLQDVGINIAAAYKINTTNKYDYRYGNKGSINAQAYYKFRIKNKLMIAPNGGVLYERSKKDKDDRFKVDISGGHVLSATTGVELGYGKVAVGINFQKALSQWLANGIVQSGNRAMLHFSFIL